MRQCVIRRVANTSVRNEKCPIFGEKMPEHQKCNIFSEIYYNFSDKGKGAIFEKSPFSKKTLNARLATLVMIASVFSH